MIAVLCCLGAVMSTYVGYIGKAFASMTGIPYGGQLLSGLHIFWIILILALVNKKGAGLLAGVLDNVVQFLLGSHLGFWVLPVGIMEGLFAEIGFWPLKKYSHVLALVVAGALSSWSNLLISQFAFNSFGGITVFGIISVYALISGAIFGGCLTYAIYKILQSAGIIVKKEAVKASTPAK
jgi:ABC-type thiamin/hydroxymethylpyrimidine transport system permease subunit